MGSCTTKQQQRNKKQVEQPAPHIEGVNMKSPLSSAFLNETSIVQETYLQRQYSNTYQHQQQQQQRGRQLTSPYAKRKIQLPENREDLPEMFATAPIAMSIRSKEGTTASRQDIRDAYRFVKVIGTGCFGKVRLAENTHGKLFAVKSIDKSSQITSQEAAAAAIDLPNNSNNNNVANSINHTKQQQQQQQQQQQTNRMQERAEDRLYLLRRELNIMKSIDHPNLVKFYETYHDEKQFHIVMEYIEGIDLQEFCRQRKQAGRVLSECEVATIMRQLFHAVSYLHAKSIIHRDLKPTNVIINVDTLHVTILDFGLSRQLEQTTRLLSLVGTPLFIAPEMIMERPYCGKVDVWGLGLLMYFMLSCGQYPFHSDSINALFKQICSKEILFLGQEWAKVSRDAKNLIGKLLVVDPEDRIDLQSASNDDWFQVIHSEQSQNSVRNGELIQKKHIDPVEIKKCLQNVLSFHPSNKLKFEILRIVFNLTTIEQDVAVLRAAFNSIDSTGEGVISPVELLNAARKANINVAIDDIVGLFSEINTRNERGDDEIVAAAGCIGYTDFMLAAIDLEKVLSSKDKIETLFKFFDKDADGFISAQDLTRIFAQEGRKLPKETIQLIIKEVDTDHHGSISKHQFFELLHAEVDTFVKTRTSFSNFEIQ